MILTKLKEYADTRMALPPPMHGETKVAWLIHLDLEGHFEGWTCLKGTKQTKRGTPMTTPHIGRTVAVKPKLLADTGEYVLGIGRPKTKPERVQDCHAQFKALVQACAEATQEPTVKAIAIFLDSEKELQGAIADLYDRHPDFDPSEVITFQVAETIPADSRENLVSVQHFWADYTASGGAADTTDAGPIMTCLVTGKTGLVEQRLPFLVKGLIGGQPGGTALVSANADPFTSYGLKNSLTSPICRDAAEGFAKALSHLIAAPDTRLDIGTTTYVFWTRQPTEFNAFSFLSDPEPQAVKNLLASPLTTQGLQGVDDANDFYALALTTSNARAVVRDWLETTIPAVQHHLQRWFTAQHVVDAYGDPGWPLGVNALAASAYRDANKEMQPMVPTALVRVALRGGRLPDDLLARVVRRNRLERNVTYPRAALIKLILTTQHYIPMTETESLATLNSEPNLADPDDRAAYHCGRLLAELEAIQRAAIGKVNASLTDRYYGAASSTPAIAFAPLLRGVRSHLAKLRNKVPGTCYALEERLESIMAELSEFPPTLSMHHQSLFALGYYHQRAHNRAAAKAAKQAKSTQE